MYQKNQICKKITTLFPDIGECGIDIKVDFDKKNKAWAVRLKKNNRELKTFLETQDTNVCMEDRHCIGFGWQVYQLEDNIRQLARGYN